ncbi:hypothetical protein PAT3040_06371 [Paenibacillus agaridevorans]|uniref:Uncharacterized protein n=1 Tax=Paenibacillus agaridevorans TaxID=171404 RepID=A0A2R5F1Y7_9BACL|nr:hypothetical protein PAT3040_06371 [Paenibacillus agaridevorans]
MLRELLAQMAQRVQPELLGLLVRTALRVGLALPVLRAMMARREQQVLLELPGRMALRERLE